MREDSEWGKQNERERRTEDGEGTEKEGPLKAKKESPGRIEPSPSPPAATTLLPHLLKCLYDQGTKPKQHSIEFNISRTLFMHGP